MYSIKLLCALVVVFAISEATSTKMTPEAKHQFCVNNPGVNYHDGCNGCACASNKSGESVCTLLPCPEYHDHVSFCFLLNKSEIIFFLI